MEEETVKIEKGEVVLKKPTAGVRNGAALAAYENGTVNELKFIIGLLPCCITSHPFGTTPLKRALDGLSIKEYDSLVEVVKGFLGLPKGDAVKKSD